MNKQTDIFKIRTNSLTPRKGRVLIAEPFLMGSYFNRSIIFLVEHNANGSMGFILNKPFDFRLPEIDDEFPNFKTKVYVGGPVDTDSLFYIHTLGDIIPGSVHISKNLYLGGDYGHLKQLINKGCVAPNQIRFFLGYSGWDKNQLQQEQDEDSWLVSEIQSGNVLKNDSKLWVEMVKKVGGKYILWENYPKDPSLN